MGFALLIMYSVIISPLNNKWCRCKGSNPEGTMKPSSYLLFYNEERRAGGRGRAWRSFNAEAGAGILEKLLFTDTDKDGDFQPSFDQIKKRELLCKSGEWRNKRQSRKRYSETGQEDSESSLPHLQTIHVPGKKESHCAWRFFSLYSYEWSNYPRFCLVYSLFNDVRLYVVERFVE
jgi:hypothetical protein